MLMEGVMRIDAVGLEMSERSLQLRSEALRHVTENLVDAHSLVAL